MNTIMKITAKLGNMRKEVEWTVYPAQKDGRVVIQSSARIAAFGGPESAIRPGKALLSKRQPNGAYFLHLSPMCGATEVDVPQEIIDAARAAQPQKGDHIGHGVFVG